MRLQAQVLVLRGDIAESRHHVLCAAVDAGGREAGATADSERVTSFRSAAKPFQLLPFVERGHADALGWGERELAIMAASHSGSREHVALVQSLLERIGLDASHLACGYHDPMDPGSLADVRRDPSLQGPIYNNCSGKHAGMLAFALAEGWPIAGYEQRDHPLQQLMLRTVAECCGVRPETVPIGIDGCGVPVFGMPLAHMARGYARIGEAWSRTRPPDGPPGDARARALQRIARAMTAHPLLVEGEGRLATDVMLATSGRVLAKSGAEGLLLLADPAQGLGIAIKCEDGAMRAMGPAVVECLLALGTLSSREAEGLAAHRRPPVHNAAGLVVGRLEAAVTVETARDVPA